MSIKDTGGPAFPATAYDADGHMSQGMTLRDYFAAKAMQAIYQANVEWTPDGDLEMDEETVQVITELARHSYQMADAMLKARTA